MIVLDASAAIDFLCRRAKVGDALGERIATASAVHVPALFDLEVLQVLRRLEATGTLAPGALGDALANFGDLRAIRHDHAPLLPRIWSLRHTLTAYDAAYVALAEALDAPLLTTDERLAKSSGHEVRIETAGG